MKYYIYRTYFLPTGEEYTGKTNSVRWEKEGYHGSGTDLRPLLKLHGKEKFKREILFEFDDEDEAYAKERELVPLEYCKLPYVLNRMPGGKGASSGKNHHMFGVPPSPEHRKNHLKAVQSEEYRRNHSKIQKKTCNTPEYKENHSKLFTELWKDPEYRKKVIESHNTPEAKENHSKAMQKVWEDEEFRKKMEKIFNSPEYKDNASKIATERWNDPEIRKKHTGKNLSLIHI